MHPDDRAKVREAIERVLEGGTDYVVEYRIIKPDGSTAWVEGRGQVERDGSGRPVRMIGVCSDVSIRRRAQDALRESEALHRAVVDAAIDGIITIDERGVIQTVNPAAIRMFGYPSEELVGKGIELLMPEPHRGQHQRYLSHYLQTGEARIIGTVRELEARRKNGSLFPIALAISESKLENRRIFTGLVRDITQRKASEQALRASEERFRRVADLVPVLIGITGADGGAMWVNRSFLEFTGRPMESHLGEGWTSFVHPDDLPGCLKACFEALAARRPFQMEFRLRRHDGVYRWVLDHSIPLFEGDTFTGYIGSCVDVTERLEAEQRLTERNRRLAQRNAALQESVGERTRTLEAQEGRLRQLAVGIAEAQHRERRQFAELLHDHLQQLLVAARLRIDLAGGRINDENARLLLVSISEIIEEAIQEARSLSAELRPPVLYQEGVVAAVAWLAVQMQRQHGLSVRTELDPETASDREDVRMLIYDAARELLFNVVKHAGVQAATVELRREGGELVLRVGDTGRGFDAGGTDGHFGLSSLRERITAFGGVLHFDTAPGRGTRVELRVPVAPVEAKAPPAPPEKTAEQTSGLRVLVVDDHRMVREGLSAVLQEAGLRVVGHAENGLDAIESSRRLRPDIALMDVHMPVMDGIEATRRIVRELPAVRVIGLSVLDDERAALAMREAGAAAFVSKSADMARLIETIRRTAAVPAGPA